MGKEVKYKTADDRVGIFKDSWFVGAGGISVKLISLIIDGEEEIFPEHELERMEAK